MMHDRDGVVGWDAIIDCYQQDKQCIDRNTARRLVKDESIDLPDNLQ